MTRSPALAALSLWLAVLATVAFLPDGMTRWMLPKAVVLAVAVVVASRVPGRGRLPRVFIIFVGVGALVLLAAAIFSDAPSAQFWGRWPRYEGAIMIPVYFAAAWLGARLLGPSGDRTVARAFTASVSVVSIAVAIVAIAESWGLRPISSDSERPGSLLGNATDQGLVGVLGVAVLLLPTLRAFAPHVVETQASRGRNKGKGATVARENLVGRRLLYAGGFLAAIVATVLSGSRAALVALAVVLVALVALEVVRAFQTPRGDRSIRAAVAIGVGLTISIAAFVFAIPATRERVLGVDGLAIETVADRILIWQETLGLIMTRPLLGFGPNGYLDAISAAHSRAWQDQVGSGTTLDSPHNWLLQAAVTGGLILVIVLIGFVGVVIALGVRAMRTASSARFDHMAGASAGILGLAVGLATHVTAPATMLLGSVLLGSIVASPALEAASGRQARRLRTARSIALTLWAGFLAVTMFAEVPLQSGTSNARAGAAEAAEMDFEQAAALRPWDSDLALIAAQSMAAAAEAQSPRAAEYAVLWARRALDATPGSLLGGKALAVGLQYTGDLAAAEQVLSGLEARHPYDSEVAHRLGGVLILRDDLSRARLELERAADLDPSSPDIWLTLEYLYRLTGDASAAEGAAKRAAALR